jgi:glucokinase
MQRAVNLPRLESQNLPELFLAALPPPVRRALLAPLLVETDVIAAGFAQWRAAPAARFLYVSVGTGVGGCAILDGQIVRHTRGGAGHFGHVIVDTSGAAPRCGCGARGCLEAVLATLRSQPQPLGQPANAADAARSPAAEQEASARALAIALLNLAHMYAPDTIVLGGGVIDHQPELVAAVDAAFAALRGSLVPTPCTVRRASLASNEAGVIGAALLALTDSAKP